MTKDARKVATNIFRVSPMLWKMAPVEAVVIWANIARLNMRKQDTDSVQFFPKTIRIASRLQKKQSTVI